MLNVNKHQHYAKHRLIKRYFKIFSLVWGGWALYMKLECSVHNKLIVLNPCWFIWFRLFLFLHILTLIWASAWLCKLFVGTLFAHQLATYLLYLQNLDPLCEEVVP